MRENNLPLSGSTGVKCNIILGRPPHRKSRKIKVFRSDLEYISYRIKCVEEYLTDKPDKAIECINYIKRKLNDLGVADEY